MKKRTVLLSVAATVLAGVAAFGWMIIRRGFSARENPSTMEAYIARTARKLSIPASERDAEEPVAPTLVRVRRAWALRINTPSATKCFGPIALTSVQLQHGTMHIAA